MRFTLAFALGTAASVSTSANAQVVVLVEKQSGRYVIVQNEKAPRATARTRALKKGPFEGWTPILASQKAGYGAMFCLRPKGGPTEFFIAEAEPSSADAVVKARGAANEAARGRGLTSYWCGAWNNGNSFPLDTLPGS